MNRQRLSVSKAKAKRRPKVGMHVGGRGGRQANIRTHGSLLRSLMISLWYLMWMEMMTHEDRQKSVELAIGHALLSAFLEYPVHFALNLAGL